MAFTFVGPTIEQARRLLEERFTQGVVAVEPIHTGLASTTFSFQAASGATYIIRFGIMRDHLERNVYAFHQFASADLPIPHIWLFGEADGFFFLITSRLPGRTLLQLPEQEYPNVLPRLMAVLDTIHHIDIATTHGYGLWDQHSGQGQSSSWKEYLLTIGNEEIWHWQSIWRETCMERAHFDLVYHQLLRLLEYCPEVRYLVHGDFGHDNVLVENGKISGVLDWGISLYGDFLYDVATLALWDPRLDVKERFRRYYAEQDRAILAYDERILCYQCYLALKALWFGSRAPDRQIYDKVYGLITSRLLEERRTEER